MSRKSKKPVFLSIVIGFTVLASMIAVGGWWYISRLLMPVNSADNSNKVITIQKGQSFNAVSNKLFKEGIIRSPWTLKISAFINGKKNTIQAGSFRLSPKMTPEEILEQLSHGTLDVWITVLEGWRREEIAEGIAKTFEENNLEFDQAAFLNATKNKEGYLYPDTYLFPINTAETTVASVLESTLQKKLTPDLVAGINRSGKNLHQILTMASVVEREARTDESRKKVAGILWKRLDNSWPLQADATLQYAKGYDLVQKTWWKPPLAVDKEINSPYNTYKFTGLPPGPICSPSLSSIEAAVFPVESGYWYYLTDNQGNMHYAATLAEHNTNVNTYLK